MKRAPLIAAVAVIILLLADPAPAAFRSVRSPRISDNETSNRTVTYTSGNVRSTRRTPTHNRSEPRTTTRAVGNVHVTSGNVRSTSTHTSRTRHAPSSTTQRTVTRRESPTNHTTARRRETPATPCHRRDATHTRTIGNVRRSGNVTVCRRCEPDDKPHRVDPPSERGRHLGFKPCWPDHGSKFFSWDNDAFICIHDGPTAPYWHRGRWHRLPHGRTHRTECGRVLYYGYWIDVRDRYYVEQIVPPWVERTVVVQDDDEFIPKAQVLDTVRVKALVLSTAERLRVEALIELGILRDILDENDPYNEFGYDYDPRTSRLTLTAPAERIAVIETIVVDRRTFEAFTQPDRYGNTAAVVPLVSPLFLEQDARLAIRLASDNFNAMRRLLEDRDRDPLYTAHGKTCWLNPECGTATLLNEPDAIERAAQFMDTRPFVPRYLVSP